jgi:two-component system sensor histidine kinase CiaH
MPDATKRKLRITTVAYWILLSYIIAALVWWAFSLEKQNETMYELRLQHLKTISPSLSTDKYNSERNRIEDLRKRNIAMYTGEGSTFLFLILVGAFYIYRSVRRQFRLQIQQQNFVMAISHELKTPISVSRLNLETLQRYKLDDSKKEKLLQMTLEETLRLDTLINNILISSQLDGRSYAIEKEDINFSDLAHDVISQFTTRYPDRKIIEDVKEEVDIQADPLLLKLLLSNLLENANKYSSREKPITLKLFEKNDIIELNIIDEGSGIEDEEKKNVFRKFYRPGNEQTRKTKGTGLGLYLCKKIVEDHGGIIIITDNKPQGSNFIVRFPV